MNYYKSEKRVRARRVRVGIIKKLSKKVILDGAVKK